MKENISIVRNGKCITIHSKLQNKNVDYKETLRNETAVELHVYRKGPPIGLGRVMQGWGGSYRGAVGHTGVGWVTKDWVGHAVVGWVGHAGVGGSCWGRVDHAGVRWCGDGVGHAGVGWVI